MTDETAAEVLRAVEAQLAEETVSRGGTVTPDLADLRGRAADLAEERGVEPSWGWVHDAADAAVTAWYERYPHRRER